MTEILFKDQIKKLVELQVIDKEIFELKSEAQEKPVEIESLRSQFEVNRLKLSQLEERSKDIVLDRRQKELELKVKEESISKANVQLSEIKTNKEYSAKLSEIENLKADKSVFEEKILISYDASDAIAKEIEQEKIKLMEEEKRFLAKKKDIEDQMALLNDRIKVLESQRHQRLVGVDQNILTRYEQLLNHKSGVAIVPVRGNTCGGCFMNVTNQMINMIKMHEQLIECEICSRVLYVEDDL